MLTTDQKYSNETQRIFRWVLFPILGLPPVGFFLIVLATPSDALQSWSALNGFILITQRVMSQVFPWIDLFRHASSTEFAQVAAIATAYAVWWWLLLMATVLGMSLLTHRLLRPLFVHMHTRKQLFFYAVAAPFFAALCFFGFFGLPGDPSFARGLTAGSRLGYAVMGTCCVLFSGVTIGMWPIFPLALTDSILARDSRA